jgi:peptide/nickel transport system ATP-binding protein/oligopeptide transport system ATP-binding protein
MTTSETILTVSHLSKYFKVQGRSLFSKARTLKALDDVSLTVKRGQTLGIVGESGCGKTTLGRTILRLYDPDGGTIVFDGQDLSSLSSEQLRVARRNMQIIFQDPFSSLNPRMSIGAMITEPLLVHGLGDKAYAQERLKELLNMVGLKTDAANRYPHEFSGGQRQRVSIARALAVDPKMIVCDEAVSALDVSVQSQILNLLSHIRAKIGLTYLFISHNLAVVRHMSDKICVMYLGCVVELADEDDIYRHAAHPYTQALFAAVPDMHVGRALPEPVKGDPPSLLDPLPGCAFASRCDHATPLCLEQTPDLREIAPHHFCACHLV